MNNILNTYDPIGIIIAISLFLILGMIIKNKKGGVKRKCIELAAFVINLWVYFIRLEAVNGHINSLFLGCVTVLFLRLAILDLRYGEMTLLDIFGVWFSILVLGILYNQTIGCPCISGNLLLFSVVVFLFILIDDFVNKEITIGGADFDCFYIILGMSITFIKTMYEQVNLPWFIISDYLYLFFGAIFINFMVYSIIYIIVKKVHKTDKGVRMIPAMILPFFLSAAVIFFKVA